MKILTQNYTRSLACLALVGFFALVLPAAPALAQDQPPTLADAIFFPPLPDEPRLQFLKGLSSDKDLGEKKKGMRSFLLGDLEDGPLVRQAYGVAIHEGQIFVTDVRGFGYGVFDLVSGTTRFVKPSGAAAMKIPGNITIDADGTRYIADAGREQVLVFDSKDNFIRIFGKAGQYKPNDILIVGERLYLSDMKHHQVHVLNKLTGEILFTIGEHGKAEGQFTHPGSMALGPDQTLWVVDNSNFRVQQFSLDGEFLSTFGSAGTSPGHFARPKGMAIDEEGVMYVVDSAFEHLQVMETSGQPLLIFGQPGDAPYHLNLPTVVKIDYANLKYFQQYAYPGFELEYLLLVANQFGTKVSVFGFGTLDE